MYQPCAYPGGDNDHVYDWSPDINEHHDDHDRSYYVRPDTFDDDNEHNPRYIKHVDFVPAPPDDFYDDPAYHRPPDVNHPAIYNVDYSTVWMYWGPRHSRVT